MSNDPNQKHYFTTIEKEELLELLAKAAEENWPVSIWIEGESDKTVEEYITESSSLEENALFLDSKGGLLSKFSSSKLKGEEVFLKIGQEKNQYFTYSTLKYHEVKKKYWVSLLTDVYKPQQRTNYRLMSNSHNNIQLKINEDMTFDGLDISAGGTSFIVEKEQETEFSKGLIFKDCVLRFNKVNFSIPEVKVAGSWPVTDKADNPTDQLKIGVAFGALSADTEERLFKHINSEARAEEMRKHIERRAAEKKLTKK